mgnify:CR=1 FL=1
MALINREYHPSPPKEEPKWWEIRERLRTTLEERGWEPSEIQGVLGKSVEEFQRMNELRTEIGMDPISGPYAIPHMLGKLDVGLAATGAGAFTKTLGQATLPYLGMLGESALAGTDIGRGMKEWPEDQPKDWRYGMMAAGLPLSALGGGMATRQLASKIPSKTKGIQTLKQGETDEMRRKILKGAAAGGVLAATPGGIRTLSKVGPTVAKVAAVSPVAAQTFMSRIPAAMNKMSGGPFRAWKTSEYGPNILQTFKKYGLTDKDFFSMDDFQVWYMGKAENTKYPGTKPPIMNRDVFADGEKILEKGQKVKDQWTKADPASNNPYATMGFDDPLTLWNDALDSVNPSISKPPNTVGDAKWVNKIKFKEEVKIDLIDDPDRFVLHEVFDFDGIPIIRETFHPKGSTKPLHSYYVDHLGKPIRSTADNTTLYMPNKNGIEKLSVK